MVCLGTSESPPGLPSTVKTNTWSLWGFRARASSLAGGVRLRCSHTHNSTNSPALPPLFFLPCSERNTVLRSALFSRLISLILCWLQYGRFCERTESGRAFFLLFRCGVIVVGITSEMHTHCDVTDPNRFGSGTRVQGGRTQWQAGWCLKECNWDRVVISTLSARQQAWDRDTPLKVTSWSKCTLPLAVCENVA